MERIKSESEYNMFDWWKKVYINNYANFSGRARRSEYWYSFLVHMLMLVFVVLLYGIFEFTVLDKFSLLIAMIYVLLSVLPTIAVSVRRLHDTGRSGWWYLLGVIPIINYIGGIVLLVFYCIEGDRGSNEYGPDPKANKDLISN